MAPIRAAAAAPTRAKPSLVVANDSDDDDNDTARSAPRRLATFEQRATQTFGQRAREAAALGSSSMSRKRGVDADDSAFGTTNEMEVIRSAPGGGMEMSFIPQPKSKADVAADKQAVKAKKAAERREKATFGAGMERSNGRDDVDETEGLEGEAESGRTRMRRPMRSASKKVTRQLK